MSNITKRIICGLFALIMLLSVTMVTGVNAQAASAEVSSEDQIDPEKVLYTFTADKFVFPYASMGSGDSVEEDPQSSVGKAAVFSYEERKATGDKGLTKALTPPATLAFYIYGRNTKTTRPIGEPTVAQLKAVSEADGYVLFLFEDVDLIPEMDDYYIYLFDCWGLQLYLTADQISAMHGKLVDVYLSMKIDGSVTSPLENPPTYYIDRIIVSEATAGDQAHEHTFDGWTFDEKDHYSKCTSCGEEKKEAHIYDEGVITKQPSETADGEKVFTCSVCDGKKTQVLNRISAEQDMSGIKNQSQKPTVNVGVIMAVVLLVAAVAIVVVALLLKKRDKK